jgi:hypothetical protein
VAEETFRGGGTPRRAVPAPFLIGPANSSGSGAPWTSNPFIASSSLG